MTRTTLNNTLWIAGLLLQLALLAVIYLRGLQRRRPAFTALLTLYPLRSVLLYLLFSRLSPATYAATASALTLAELLMLVFVTGELALQLMRSPGGSRFRHARRHGLLLLLLAGMSWAMTVLLSQLMPSGSPMPADRLQAFLACLLILLCGWSFRRPVSDRTRALANGLAVVALAGLVSASGRALAALHRDPRAFALWSYGFTAIYLLVVVYWIATFAKKSKRRKRRSHKQEGQPQTSESPFDVSSQTTFTRA